MLCFLFFCHDLNLAQGEAVSSVLQLATGSPSPSFQSQTLACCLLLATSRRVARERTNKTSSDQIEPKSNHAIAYLQSAVERDQTAFPGKRKTDLERSVSLLTPHYPSDHIQVAVQRPPESSVSTLSVLRVSSAALVVGGGLNPLSDVAVYSICCACRRESWGIG